MRNKLLLLGVIIGGLITLGWPTTAVSAAPLQGITLSPFLQPVEINPGDTSKTFTLTITNNMLSAQQLHLSPQDFGSLNDSGGILFAGNAEYSQKYGLTSWLTLATNSVLLEPGESKAVDVTIDNRSSLQPGGHYGAVIASIDSESIKGSNNVQISQQLTSLILVTKHGGEHFDLSLKDIAPNGNWLHLPNTVRLRFQNPGNVHVIPRGVVSLKNSAGQVVARGVINDDSNYVLPETYRQIYVKLTPVKTGIQLPGPYTVSVDYRYDGLAVTRNKTIGLRFAGLKIYLVFILIVGLLIVVGFRRYKRRNPVNAN
ncbi:hypothetical protein H7171_03600 [Candidatus Saccharibacteria bacterium]|nr:hypothetical protein [Candidatus Saccharibacteria bacterium]